MSGLGWWRGLEGEGGGTAFCIAVFLHCLHSYFSAIKQAISFPPPHTLNSKYDFPQLVLRRVSEKILIQTGQVIAKKS